MIKMWIFAIVAAFFALTGVRAADTTFTLVDKSTKVCQLNGEDDWETGKPTAARTLTNFGMYGADLGAPIDTGGSTLYFLFGDTWPHAQPPPLPADGVLTPNDSVGTSTLTTRPDKKDCLGLQVATTGASPPAFNPPVVMPAIDQGYFNVPSGGVYANSSLYVFFWTNHCLDPDKLTPMPSDPLKLPSAPTPPYTSTTCYETSTLNSIGISVLGQEGTNDVSFNTPMVSGIPVMIPSGFVYVNAVDPTNKPNLAPSSQRLGVFITGVPRYRASVPYLAYSTPANLANPSNWMFFNGLSAGTPIWISYASWQSYHNPDGDWMPPSPVAQIYNPTPSQQCVGEHSLSWNAPLNAWLLLYNCVDRIEARYARAPWGPWSEPIVLISPTLDPNIYCTLIMKPVSSGGCPALTTYWPDKRQGGLYAPFVLSRFTEDASGSCYPPPRPVGLLVACARIYWLVSTWNPYVVVVMKSTLMMTTFL
jgi:hypothetical protein